MPPELSDEEFAALPIEQKKEYLRQMGFREITDLEGWGLIVGIPPAKDQPKS